MTGTASTRNLDDIAEALRAAHDRGGKCTLLIGAGCSLGAGIPLSSGIVDDIHKTYPVAYKHAQERRNPPGYGDCMRELAPGQRRDLLKGYIDKARVNWAHIGLAQLVKHGYVDRILTTNFDPLIARGCALVNEFPAVYDLTASTYLRPADLPDRAIFHLHGQRNGFVLLNESGELEKHAQQLQPVFAHARDGRVWIVAGYSGGNDPLFSLIRDVERYEYDLFWIGLKPEPAPALTDFFSYERRCFHVHYPRGADTFFMALAHKLDAWPPVFVDNPFQHVRQQLEAITEQGEDGTGRNIDWLKQARDKINAAEACLAAQPPSESQEEVGKVQAAFLEGGGEQASAVSTDTGMKASLLLDSGIDLDNKANSLAATDLPAARKLWRQAGERFAQALKIKPDEHWAVNNWGIALTKEAKALAATDPAAARELWRQAGERCNQALDLKPNDHWAANNWGSALADEAQALATTDLAAARELWQQAGERYAQVLAIKPDMHDAAYNWGIALADEAQALVASDLAAAHARWRQAGERYAQALAIKPDMHDAANNWGSALVDEARALAATDLSAARELWRQAGERYAQALAIKPDMHEAAYNWGSALAQEAQALAANDLPAARELWRRAGERYAQALALKPDKHETANNWGIALANEAQALAATDLATARARWQQAGERYAQALAIKPDMHDAANNWGSALLHLYRHVPAAEKAAILDQAEPLLLQAEQIKEGAGAYNLACLFGLRQDAAACVGWLRTAKAAGQLDVEHMNKDGDLDSVRDSAEYQAFLKEIGAADAAPDG